jgi:hypothetical protein
LVFINSKYIGEYISTGEDYQSIKVLGKVLLNEYMVPFEFASILLLVAMIGTVLLSKKEKQRNNMNNILNEIGIENYIFPFYDTFCGVFGVYTDEMQLSYLCLSKLC